jgi:ribonucleoside-diphosphate reductase alpha chain
MFQDIIRPALKEAGLPSAQMGTMHVWHPDIIDFIKAKREDGRFRQFNLSVLLTDKFMRAVEEDADWDLYFPMHQKEYATITSSESCLRWVTNFPFNSPDYVYRPSTNIVACKIYQTIKARELWDLVMKSTFEYAEPGVLFIDRINNSNPLYKEEVIVATNPCGEQPLPPYGSCLLGSILLTKFVENPFKADEEPYETGAYFDWDRFKEVARIFVRMLDNVIELNGLALPEQVNEIKNKRRHGMGFLGLGSALAMLRIPYGSADAIEFTEEVARVIAVINLEEGFSLAVEKGKAPIFEDKDILKSWVTSDFVQKVIYESSYVASWQLEDMGCRFTHATSIAPTGTLSLAIGNNCSNGIEPSFAHEYKRNIVKEGHKTKEQVTVYSAEALLWKELYGDAPYPDYFTVADDLTPTQHVAMQAAAQKWVDSSISKTVNCPTDISFEDFKQVYIDSYYSGLKGCATFRFNPEIFSGVLVKEEDLAATLYEFTLESGDTLTVTGNETVIYQGEEHNAANLFDALKEGYFGRF